MSTNPPSTALPLPAMVDYALIKTVRDTQEDSEDSPRFLSTRQASDLIGCPLKCLSQAR